MRHIREEPRVMVSLNAADDGEDIVLFEGEAERLTAPSSEVMPAGYATKYDALLKRIELTTARMVQLYRQPISIRLMRRVVFS